jgi:hypothetical protein
MNRETVKKIGLWLLVIALSAAHVFFRSQAHAVPATPWKEIYSRSGDCRISFPVLPQMVQQNLKLNSAGMQMTYDIYLAPYKDHGICLLLVAQYPMELSPGHEKAGLEGLLKGIVGQHPENELIFSEFIEQQGIPAINFLVQSGKNYFRGQALMVGSKLYMIAMEGTKQHFEESVFQLFLKSFSLIKS